MVGEAGSLVADYVALHRLLGRIAASSSDGCSEAEVAEVAISHERAVRVMAGIGLQRIRAVSDRDAHRSVQCSTVVEFVAQRLRVATPKRRLHQVSQLTSSYAISGQRIDPICPATAAATTEGAVGHEHADAVLAVMAKVPTDTPVPVREQAEAQLADIARQHSPRDITRAGLRILAYLDPDGTLPSDRDRARNRGLSLGAQDSLGMSKLSATLDPTTRALVEVLLAAWAAPGMNNPDDEKSPRGGVDDDRIDAGVVRDAAQRDTRSQVQRNHDALAAVVRAAADGGLYGASHRGLPPHVIVSITESQLRERAGVGHTATGTDLPMSQIVTLAAQAQMHLAVFDDHTGEPLYLGRANRLASQSQRMLLFTMYGGCSKAACPVPFAHTEVHHAEQDWAAGGVTDAPHLAPACGPHNRAVRTGPGGWQTVKITAGPDRGRYGWIANGTNDPPRTNHLHRPDRILDEHPPAGVDWSQIEHALNRILAEHQHEPPEPVIIRVIDYLTPPRP